MSEIISCPRCDKPIEPEWRFCPHCEAVLQGPERGERGGIIDSRLKRSSYLLHRGFAVLLEFVGGLALIFALTVAPGITRFYPQIPSAVVTTVLLVCVGLLIAVFVYVSHAGTRMSQIVEVCCLGALASMGALVVLSLAAWFLWLAFLALTR
jgi:hypothetical protein